MTNRYHLYFDDTGSRDLGRAVRTGGVERRDGMDCFGLGGLLIREEDIPFVVQAHKEFCTHHKIDYPLHSWAIRGGRKNFGWLKKPEKAGIFLAALEELIISLPIIVVGCIVHRSGYFNRYSKRYEERLWFLCKTAFSILIERSAKFVRDHDVQMEIYFEQTGEKEDRAIIRYMKDLKSDGLLFDAGVSEGYSPLSSDEFRVLVLGKPQRKTKKMPLIQLADLVLYPLAKSGYDSDYRKRNMAIAG